MKEKIKEIRIKLLEFSKNIKKKFIQYFDREKRLAFFTVLVIGFLTHIIALSNLLLTGDGLWIALYRPFSFWDISLGRWSIPLTHIIRAYISIPQVTITIGIFIVAISTILIIDLFKIKNKIYIFLVSIAFAVSPTLTYICLYPYIADTYCYGMLLSILSIVSLKKVKKKILKFF